MMRRGVSKPAVGILRAAAAAFVLAGVILPLVALAADPPPDPDRACARAKSFKSTSGVHPARLTIINNTDQPLESLWLDYNGKRVLYERIRPHSRYTQPTWLTHPWIVANLKGKCYRLVVMTSLRQTVTVNPGTGGEVATPEPVATPTPIATTSAEPVATPTAIPTPAPVQTAAPLATATTLPDPSSASAAGPSDTTLPLLLAAGAVTIAAVAGVAYWATHRGP